MNTVRLIAAFVENKPGQTARITKALADARVNIRWVTIATSGAFGVMKFLVDKCEVAFQSLKEHGVTVSFLEVLAVEVQDKPGALHGVADCLAKSSINLDNTSGFVAKGRAVLVIEAHDLVKAQKVLRKHGLRLLSQEEMLRL